MPSTGVRAWRARGGIVETGHVLFRAPFRTRIVGRHIAHGYLTCSLLVPMWAQVVTVTDAVMAVS
jgi:hypothetical protein